VHGMCALYMTVTHLVILSASFVYVRRVWILERLTVFAVVLVQSHHTLIPLSPSAMHGQRVRLQCSLSLFLSLCREDRLPVPAADGEEGKDQKKTTAKSSGIFQYIFFTDGRSKTDFVFEILVRPMSSSAISTEQPIRELHREVDSIQTSLKLLLILPALMYPEEIEDDLCPLSPKRRSLHSVP
jgi:hypothetical protein